MGGDTPMGSDRGGFWDLRGDRFGAVAASASASASAGLSCGCAENFGDSLSVAWSDRAGLLGAWAFAGSFARSSSQ